VEDIAEEAERGAGRGGGVRELGRVQRDPGGGDSVGVGGHHASVGEDGGEVQRAAGRDHQQARDVAVDHEEGAEQQVAREVDLLLEAARAAGQDRDDQDLHHEGADGEPGAAELEVGQPRQPAPRQRHRQDAQQQGGADQHRRDIDPAPAWLEPAAPPGHRTSVQPHACRSRRCR
jgi:hypothetical protein